ncbi:hypothetical protein RGQ29_013647 [Quercus rubra]|uniref:CC-NBS-LRR protein n=1 Tax=Quercus rubra TaxID=3512 RepID=A0AAN7J274_QUERU|nr:hypothetical protein RGQ29_013647 [Quercus rubra]
MGGEEEDSVRFTIIPCLQHLQIRDCPKLKSLPNFLRTTPLQKLYIYYSPILEECCKRGTGEEWPKIFHIPNIIYGSPEEHDEEMIKVIKEGLMKVVIREDSN